MKSVLHLGSCLNLGCSTSIGFLRISPDWMGVEHQNTVWRSLGTRFTLRGTSETVWIDATVEFLWTGLKRILGQESCETKCESGELDFRERSIRRKPISCNHSDALGCLELHGSIHTATQLPQIAPLLEFSEILTQQNHDFSKLSYWTGNRAS